MRNKFSLYSICVFGSLFAGLISVICLIYGAFKADSLLIEIAIWLIILSPFLYDIARSNKKKKKG